MSGINLTLLGSSSKDTFWMATLGTTSRRIEGNNIAIDSAGNAHIAGFWEQTSVEHGEAYLYKIDKDGAIQWQKQLGTSGTSQVNSDIYFGIALDSSGNSYVGGYTFQLNSRYALLAKYNSSGAFQFQTSVGGGATSPYFKEVRVDSNNNVYAVGTYTDPTNGDSFATFKFNSSGTFQSMYNLFTSTGSEDSTSLAIDSSDNFYTVGTQYDPSGDRYALLSKRNSSGTLQWQTRVKGSSNEKMFGYACAVNASGNIVQVGERIAASSPYPAYIAYYDSTPTLQWSRTLVGTSTAAFDVALDSSNNSYVCGRNDNSGYQGFIAKYNGSGTIQFQRTITVSSRVSFLNSIRLDAKGNIYVCGTIEGSPYYAFVAKLPNDGSLTGTYTVGSLSITYAASSLTDASVSTTQTTPTLTNGTPSISQVTPTLTDAVSTFTYAITTI